MCKWKGPRSRMWERKKIERKCVCALLERECVRVRTCACVSVRVTSFTKLHSRHVRVTDPHFSLEFIFSPLSHTHSLSLSHTHTHSLSLSHTHTHIVTHSHSYKSFWIFKLPSSGVDSQSQFLRKCIFVKKKKKYFATNLFSLHTKKMIGDIFQRNGLRLVLL